MTLAQRTHWDDARHAAARARCAAATEGPWLWSCSSTFREHAEHLSPDAHCPDVHTGRVAVMRPDKSTVIDYWAEHANDAGLAARDEDLNFVVGARTDLPDALAEIERLRAELAARAAIRSDQAR